MKDFEMVNFKYLDVTHWQSFGARLIHTNIILKGMYCTKFQLMEKYEKIPNTMIMQTTVHLYEGIKYNYSDYHSMEYEGWMDFLSTLKTNDDR